MLLKPFDITLFGKLLDGKFMFGASSFVLNEYLFGGPFFVKNYRCSIDLKNFVFLLYSSWFK